MPAPFSKAMEYWKPEQPPPTTDNRNPDGTGVCAAMISLTLAMAAGVRIGAEVLGCTPGMVVVAICFISLYLAIITKVLAGSARLFTIPPNFWRNLQVRCFVHRRSPQKKSHPPCQWVYNRAQ